MSLGLDFASHFLTLASLSTLSTIHLLENHVLSLRVELLPVESEMPGAYLSRKSDLVIFRLDLAARMIVRHCRWLRTGGRPERGILSSDWRSYVQARKLLIVVMAIQ